MSTLVRGPALGTRMIPVGWCLFMALACLLGHPGRIVGQSSPTRGISRAPGDSRIGAHGSKD